MKYDMYVVTGAPGSGKTTALEAFLSLETDYIAFDIDWLAIPAGTLANRSIFTDPSTWKPYAALWFEIIHCAISDAVELRNIVSNTHDTGKLGPEKVATELLDWLEK